MNLVYYNFIVVSMKIEINIVKFISLEGMMYYRYDGIFFMS